jgi:hypothetical protein
MKAKPITTGDDVKHIKCIRPVTPGARAGVATARAINKSFDVVSYGVRNVVDFATHFWKGRIT